MSTSGAQNFNMTAGQIVEKAFHVLGKAAEGEAMTPRMYADGLSSLNLMIKTMGASDRLWVRTERTVALVAGQIAYALSPRPLRVISARRRTSGIDVPLLELSRQEYDEIPTKTINPATPISFYFDPQVPAANLYVWPAASASVAASTELRLTVLRRMDDMVTAADDLDMPQEWFQAVIWNLADDLETEYPVNDARLAGKIERRAAILRANLTAWDNEPAAIYFQPSPEMMHDPR